MGIGAGTIGAIQAIGGLLGAISSLGSLFGGGSDTPQPAHVKEAAPPKRDAQSAVDRQRRLAAGRQGRSGTILTSSLGVTGGNENIAAPTLLGA